MVNTKVQRLTREDATITMSEVNKFVIYFSLVVCVVTYLLFWALWGIEVTLTFPTLMWFCVWSILLIVIHELLHAIGFIFLGKAKISDVKFGVLWKSLTPYAHCKIALPIQAYRIAIMLPLVILGVLPTIMGLVIGHGMITLLGAYMIIGAAGDILIYKLLHSYEKEVVVEDHPEKVGCIVYK